MARRIHPLLWSFLALLAVAGLTALAPQERTLGENVRIIYLHGAWVLTAEAVLGLSAAAGLLGILLRRKRLHTWSTALGRSGLCFWVSSLPLSLWAMQTNWNGLFLAEPRFRIAVIFAVTGVLVQAGLSLIALPGLNSFLNVLYFASLVISLRQANYVMHPPPSPIFSSGVPSIMLFFLLATCLSLVSAGFLARAWVKD
jgi:hypothetical protein